MNIFNHLLHMADFRESRGLYHKDNMCILVLDNDTVDADNIDQQVNADIFIFATKHQSSAGVHSLSVHTPGNWGPAEMGGREGLLCTAPANYLKRAFILLNEAARGLEYEITVEQTHHGPFMNKPCMFIEIGSTKEHWQNEQAGSILSKTILSLTKESISYKSAVFLGGGHYNREANKIQQKTDYAIGHICAKHNLRYLNESMLLQAINRTMEKVELVILDWKGLGEHKPHVISMLEKNNIKYERSKRLG